MDLNQSNNSNQDKSSTTPDQDVQKTQANRDESNSLEDIDYNNETWDVIKSYFDINRNYLTKHHIESYNDFILNKLPQTFVQYNPQILFKEYSEDLKKYKYTLNIYYGGKDGSEVFIGKPIIYKREGGVEVKKQMYPNEARLRNLSYSSHILYL